MGIEVIAVTAGEAQDPRTAIPRAMRTMVLRLVLFYVLAVTVMLAMTPWTKIGESGGGLTGSPFVRAFATVGVPYAATLMNLVVISAALSSANANLYLTARMLFSLGRSGYAPAWLARVNDHGVPRFAVLAASAGMIAAILLAIYAPAKAFLALYGLAVSGMLFIWIVVLITYLRFRQALTPEAIAALPIRLPAARASAVCGIIALAAIVVTSRWVSGLEYSALSLIPCLVILSLIYLVVRRREHT
jgi:L-asparagine transporter-like permease